MVAGRLRWREPNAKSPGKIGLARAHFAKRKSYVKNARSPIRAVSAESETLFRQNLHGAKLSPLAHTQRLNAEEIERLFDATRMKLREWTDRLLRDMGEKFPDKVTYCARCQTGGVILAERALSRLLKKSWPRALEDLE